MGVLHNRVRELRRARGMSASALAAHAQISRQSLAAIESERSSPSAAVALRIAAALESRVEALFFLAEPVLATTQSLPEGTRVVVGEVDGQWVAHPLEPGELGLADGIGIAVGGFEPLRDIASLRRNVLVAGCAPVLGALTGHVSQSGTLGARWRMRASRRALAELAEGRVHIAGFHLAHLDDPAAHDALLRSAFPGEDLDVIHLVGWREGLAFPAQNPHGIASVHDLHRPELRVGLRSEGSGAAKVLAEALGGASLGDLSSRGVPVASHLEAARAIQHDRIDSAVLIEPIAEAFGLGFIPISEERFELALRRRHRTHPGVRQLLDHLTTRGFAREVQSMGAYDTTHMGTVRPVTAA